MNDYAELVQELIEEDIEILDELKVEIADMMKGIAEAQQKMEWEAFNAEYKVTKQLEEEI